MLDLTSRVNFDENFGNLVSQLIPEDDTHKRYNDKPCACGKFTTLGNDLNWYEQGACLNLLQIGLFKFHYK